MLGNKFISDCLSILAIFHGDQTEWQTAPRAGEYVYTLALLTSIAHPINCSQSLCYRNDVADHFTRFHILAGPHLRKDPFDEFIYGLCFHVYALFSREIPGYCYVVPEPLLLLTFQPSV